jgi:hypothetical protein
VEAEEVRKRGEFADGASLSVVCVVFLYLRSYLCLFVSDKCRRPEAGEGDGG